MPLYLCEVIHSWWFLPQVLWFQNHPSTFWLPQVWLAFSAGSGNSAQPQCRFLRHHSLLLDVANQRVFSRPLLVPLRSALPLLLRPPPLVSVLTFSPLLSASPTSSPSFQMTSLPMVLWSLCLPTRLATTCWHSLVLRSLLNLFVLVQRSLPLPRLSSLPWRKQA